MGEKIQDTLNSPMFENWYFLKSLQLQHVMQFNLYKKKLSSPCEENVKDINQHFDSQSSPVQSKEQKKSLPAYI